MSLFRKCGRNAAVQLRGFSSSSSLRVGPESPNFIEVPKPIQPAQPSKRRVKGTLPVPREIFPKRRLDKPNKHYLADVAPVSTNQEPINPNEPHAEYRHWKRNMADMRRKNIEQGLLELHSRKKRIDTTMEDRSERRQRLRNHVLRQVERPDEMYTRPSIPSEFTTEPTAGLPDPGRAERLAASRLRMANKRMEKELERQDSLHTLYMDARTFITTEAQLAAEIEKVFPEGANEAWDTDHSEGLNIWNLGFPRGMNVRLNETASKRESERFDVTQSRVKKLGEMITGGKI